ncbi:hypothetical protein ACFQUU_15350 [Herbaspirillum sp. GCM10030257]|uniref:hypothetical protein n=1 Tax=Herbaspirillum sp. GCM10030257 TaxID=3273393 RepID=UPI0036072784
MKNPSNKAAAILLLLLVHFVSGCGGYARTGNSGSGVQVYGTIDAGVQHQRSH